MDELDLFFLDMDAQQMSLLLENKDVTADEELSRRIKNKTLPDFDKKEKTVFITMKRILAVAACFCISVAASYFGTSYYKEATAVTAQPTTVTTEAASSPLMAAIASGNEDIIVSLLKSSTDLGKEIVEYAISYIDTLSYSVIHTITQTVYNTAGTTGLDSLLEGAILGDSKRVLEELKSRQKLLMTPGERLAFFFSVAFCDSEVVDSFVEKGYDVNTTDSKGDSIYEIAEKNGNEENQNYALSKGVAQ